MLRALVDTDILSEIFNAVDKQVMRNAANYVAAHSVITFTSVTLYEIITGLEQNQAQGKLVRTKQMLHQNDEIVPESEDYALAARILGTLRRTGKEVGYSDPLIAACAIRRGIAIVTGNQKHFSFIHNAGFPLNLQNWRNF